MKFFQNIFKFIKKYPGILYSLFLIIFLPLAFYLNVFFNINSFQKNVDENFRTKALMIESVFGSFAEDFISQPDALQKKIEEIVRENTEITNLRVFKEENSQFRIIASQDASEIGRIDSDPSLSLSWSQNQTIANLFNENKDRFWKVTKPIILQENKEKIGLVSLALSLKESDALITHSVYLAYLIVIASIIFCLFLVIQHTRLFGYVALSKKLQELDKMKDDFIRMATHELQTPITNIKGYIEVLKEEISGVMSETQNKYLSRIEISARNLSDLIYDILEVSRIEQGRLEFTAEKINPEKIIKETVEAARMKAEAKGLNLSQEVEASPSFIKVNANRFRQVLTNLIENAIKYTPTGGILVSSKIDPTRKRYVICVSDSGLGVSAEAQKRLFERFYRVKTKNTADIPGTGLGLWITKQIIETMGGNIYFESMEGTGTKFFIIFPSTN